jgi:hypothetical protein
MADLFERLAAERPPSAEEKTKQPTKLPPEQRMLNWLQRWPKNVVSVRDMRVWGPRIFRDKKKAISAAEILAERGWLTPVKSHWPGTYAWRVMHKPIAHPVVDI